MSGTDRPCMIEFMNVATALLRHLHSTGIRRIFGVVGREASAISFTEWPDIDFILTRHEFSAGVIACAVSRFTGSAQACFATIGPGATNLMTALATAMLDRYPLIAIAAQVETDTIEYNNAHQCVDGVSMARYVTKFSCEIRRADEVESILEEAVATALAHPPGPVFLSIPIDTLSALMPAIPTSARNTTRRGTKPHDGSPSPVAVPLDNIVRALQAAETPLLVIGDAAIRDGMASKIVRLAEHLNVPAVTSFSAKGALPAAHPLNYGAISPYMDAILEYPALDTVFGPSDLLLLLCHDPAESLYPRLWTRGVRKTIVRIAPYPNLSSATVCPDIDAICPLADAIAYLSEHATLRARQPHDITGLRRRVDAMFSDKSTNHSSLRPTQVLSALEDYFHDYILASDVGLHRHVSAIFYKATRPGDFVTSAGLSSFGTGLPLGIGAKLANPERQVVVIAGDGGFHSSSGELETVVRLKLDLTILVLNNSASRLIERYAATGRASNPAITHFGSVNFAALAEANGCRGFSVMSMADLRRALAYAATKGGSTLIDVPVDYPGLYLNEFTKDYHAAGIE